MGRGLCAHLVMFDLRDLEDIPACLKLGVITPVYKGKGKDPYAVDSYRPITVTSTLSKVLELVLLQRMELTLREAGIPHLNQTAYRKNVSCADGIFSTQEAILRYINDGSTVYMCMFDLQKPMTVLSFQCYLTASTTLG